MYEALVLVNTLYTVKVPKCGANDKDNTFRQHYEISHLPEKFLSNVFVFTYLSHIDPHAIQDQL